MILGEYIVVFGLDDKLACLTAFSDSPTHLLNSSGPFTAKKLSPLSVANARATRVLLHPGGPYIRIPLGGLIPSRLNACKNIKSNQKRAI